MKYRAAESEVEWFFGVSLGVQAQRYDGEGGGDWDSERGWRLHERMVGLAGDVAKARKYRATLRACGASAARVLAVVYATGPWDGWLMAVVGTVGNGGTLAGLVVDAAWKHFAAAHGGREPEGRGEVAVWLGGEARKARMGLIRELGAVALREYEEALAEYDRCRRLRIEAERLERAADIARLRGVA
jgi:hypothetical protein